jgi:Iap family predicted aminopeptidase
MALLAPLGPGIAADTFSDAATVKAALQEHAKVNSYAISVESSNPKRIFFICTKGGYYSTKGKDPTIHPSRQRRNTSTIKTGCPYKVVARTVDGVGYTLEVLDNNHNHGPVVSLSALPQHRVASMTLEERAIVKDMSILGHSPGQILDKLRQANSHS